MSRALTLVLIAAPCVMILTGCRQGTDEYATRITMLEDSNQSLLNQLDASKNDLSAAQEDRDILKQELSRAMRDRQDLRQQLASAKPSEPVVVYRDRLVPAPAAPTPQVAPGWTPVEGGAMIAIEGTVLFPSGKAVLRDEAKRTLDQIATTLAGTYADSEILVIGHTDDRPIKKSGWTDNYELSSERALAVVRYLGNRSVSATRLVAGGAGEHRPRVPNKTEADRQSNRRVEIYAMDRRIGA